MTVDLAGTDPVNIKHVQVSALVSSGQSRFTALRQFELWGCDGRKGADFISNTKASHLRLVVKTNQCTGGPQFQGRPGRRSINNADCDLNPTAAVRFVCAAELQAFSAAGSVPP